MTGPDELFDHASSYVASFEGFEPRAYWDVNAWRIGFGSDTKGAAQVRVQRGDYTTRADAILNLRARLPQFWAVVLRECPNANELPLKARIALLDMAYNYGSLPRNVAYCVNLPGHTLAAIASAVRAHQSDNGGINAHRRQHEAEDIETAMTPLTPAAPLVA